jgi:hypothetical protein
MEDQFVVNVMMTREINLAEFRKCQ